MRTLPALRMEDFIPIATKMGKETLKNKKLLKYFFFQIKQKNCRRSK